MSSSRTQRPSKTSQRGMTLIEILVALTIFSVISAAMVGLLALTGNGRTQIDRISTQISTLEGARSIVRTDMMQVLNRPYRQPFATGSTPAFLGGAGGVSVLAAIDGETILCAFVRNGWANPNADQPRASIQRVEYLVREGKVIRRVRPFVDAMPGTPVREQVLFANVEQVEVRFRGAGRWLQDWGGSATQGAPRAFRISFVDEDYGPITQDFLVGAGDD
ncbi:MAG: type II secretion system minor pseudopilin GspJ [Parvularcula sp.]